MDINLPLILVLASFAGIIIYSFDVLVLRAKRAAAITELKRQLPDWNKPESAHAKTFADTSAVLNTPHWLVRETKSLLPVILVVLVVRSFVVEPFQIPSSSMEPTLLVGDFILVNKFTYGIRLPVTRTKVIDVNQPERGDVMVFFPPKDKRYFIKRIVGLPGDLIEYKDKQLWVNGEKQSLALDSESTDLLKRQILTENLSGVEHQIYQTINRPPKQYRLLVKSGHYFMMGDNRDNSHDSRFWGSVPENNIVGKAFAIWMHWRDWSSLPSFSSIGSIR
jgi:signal peptidase I